MRPTRRGLLGLGGSLAAAACLPGAATAEGDAVEIVMGGRGDGGHVWFQPQGLLVRPGQTIRWVNRDKGNAHTATAYHPAHFERPRRMPSEATPWHSDYLLPGERFAVRLTVEGVYDYYCVPHELAGMVGRIVVGDPGPAEWMSAGGADEGLPQAALQVFPAVEEIVRKGRVVPARTGG